MLHTTLIRIGNGKMIGVAWCARDLSEWDIPLSAAVAVARCADSKRAERLGALSARGASVLDSAQCLTLCYLSES